MLWIEITKKNVKFTYFKWCLYLELVKSSGGGGGGDGPASDITAAEPVVSVSTYLYLVNDVKMF